MRRLILALAFLLCAAGQAVAANCPSVLADCGNINANIGRFGGAINGATLVATPLASGGNLYFGTEVTYSNISGGENVFVGDKAGGAFTGNSSFLTALGHNACGNGAGAPSVGNNTTCYGNDAARNVYATSPNTINNLDAFGASALKVLGDGTAINAISAFGAFAGYNLLHPAVAPSYTTIVGPLSCIGATGAAFWHGTCVGGHTGGALSTAHDFLILGQGVGNATFASGSNVILIGSGGVTVDTAAAGTSNYINIENILTVTGTGTPSTSTAAFAGKLTVTGALNGATLSATALGSGGNAYFGTEVTYSNITGTENTLFGDKAGGAFTGLASFNSAFGHNACGGGGAAGAGSNNNCFGTDAGRNINGASVNLTLFGNTAGYSQTAAASGFTYVGVAAGYYNNDSNSGSHSSAFGFNACLGASGGATFGWGNCFGSNTGGALTSAIDFLLIGGGVLSVGNATCASGQGFILIGSGNQTVDCPLAATSYYINMENILTVTGTNTPSTSIAQFAGNLIVGPGSALATNATSGLLRLATMAGAPTGTTGAAGQAAVVIDTTNKKICYSTGGGTWECSAAFTP